PRSRTASTRRHALPCPSSHPHLFTSLRFPFFLTATAPPPIYTLSLHDALPISAGRSGPGNQGAPSRTAGCRDRTRPTPPPGPPADRKSTRLNSSHVSISYAVFCVKKKKQLNQHKEQPHHERKDDRQRLQR